jgi:hypothetical protein
MYLVVNATGELWTGDGWNVRGREFFTLGLAKRSLHEEGEDIDSVTFILSDLYKHIVSSDTSQEVP